MPSNQKIATILRKFHLTMTGVWALLVVPTVTVWPKSVLWIALMSAWANMMAHFAAYMASRTEQREIDSD